MSPDDATELGSLRTFTRELMDQASRDLGTNLDWIAIDHWNTEHPHIHILVRGRADDGSDLVISRDYISNGLRARAGDLVTRELGPRSELEVQRGLEVEVAAERWTRLDRVLAREAGSTEGVVDLRPEGGGSRNPIRDIQIGRLTAACVTPRASAARVKLLSRAVKSKAFKAPMGGSALYLISIPYAGDEKLILRQCITTGKRSLPQAI